MTYWITPINATVLRWDCRPQTLAVHKFAGSGSRKARIGAGFQWYLPLRPRTASISADTCSGGVCWEMP
jgi:hypothetical protein